MFVIRHPAMAVGVGLAFCVAMAPCAQATPDRQTEARQFNSAVSHFNSGNYQEAAGELEDLVKRAPSNFDVQELLGLVYTAQSKFEDAHARFEKAVQLRPNSGPARANLAVNLSKLGKNDEAESQFKKAIAVE